MKSSDAPKFQTEITETELFLNQTGVMANPDLAAELIQGAKKTIPSSESDGEQVEANQGGLFEGGITDRVAAGYCP